MKLSLNTQIFIGALFGIVVGTLLNTGIITGDTASNILYGMDILGVIFVGLLKMVLIPLVFTSVAAGIANLKAHVQMDKVWKYTLIYFLLSPIAAASLGLLLVNIVQPGKGLDIALFKESVSTISAQSMGLGEFFKTFIKELLMNPVAAMANTEVLATLFFAILLGISIVCLKDKANTVHKFLNEFFDVIMLIVQWIMKFAPLGVMGLLTKLIATQNISLLSALGKFVGVVVFGTLFHGIVVLPLALFALTGVGPFKLFTGIREALITAFSTSSSSATLPVTIRCTTENLKVDKNIVGFVAPLGATLNMDGTALYEAMAAIFIANLVGIDLNLIQQIIVLLTAVLASIGAPGIPSAGLVTMIMVLQSVGLPVEAIAILLPIDRPLDAIRTAVNVEGDSVCSLIVQRFSSKK